MESDTRPEGVDGAACQEHHRATVCAVRDATKGTGTRTQPVADTRPLVLLRYRSDVVGQSARTVHLAPLPTGDASEIRALCGALLPSDHVETLSPGQGMPCTSCLLSPRLPGHTPGPSTENPLSAPALPTQDDTNLPPQVLATRYRAWGWPVTLRGNHVCLSLGKDTVALMIPLSLAVEVTAVLCHRRCPPPVLAHPYAPEHQVLLAGERYGVELPWPPGVHRVIETLLIPPTVTARGPIIWVHPPEPDALTLCREVDVVAALRTVLRGSSSIEYLPARGLADECQHVSLPQRSPGAHLHPRLRRTPVAKRCGQRGSSE